MLYTTSQNSVSPSIGKHQFLYLVCCYVICYNAQFRLPERLHFLNFIYVPFSAWSLIFFIFVNKNNKNNNNNNNSVFVFSLPLYLLCTSTAMPILQKFCLTIIASQIFCPMGRIGLLPCDKTTKISFIHTCSQELVV